VRVDDEVREKLIAAWVNDPELQVGVPYRRMASQAVDMIDSALREAFSAGFLVAIDGTDRDGEYCGDSLDDAFNKYREGV
jgi:hypothetical protein